MSDPNRSLNGRSHRLYVVGGEQREGKDLVWIEMAMTSTHGNMIMQMLVPGYPYEPSGVQEIIMKAGNQPAMKMGPAMMGMIRSQMANNPGASMQEACKNVTLVGEESVTVPAGSFSTRHYRSTGAHAGDSWIARGQAFGLVKSTDGEHEMVLTGTGNDAKSSITETPQEMPGM